MSKEIVLFGPVEIVPLALPPKEQGGQPQNGKQLVLLDMEAGEEYIIRMDEESSKEIGRKLRMNNKALSDHLQQKMKDASARAALDTSGVDPRVVEKLTQGVHTR